MSDTGIVRTRRAEAVSALRAAGLREGQDLLVHSAWKSVRNRVESPDELFDILAAAAGKSATLLFPALSYSSVTPDNPRFDLARTESCVGFLAERFRTTRAAGRSLHPTHSACATGPGTKAYLDRHGEDRTPVGAASPFSLLREAGGAILMLGCGLEPCTSMHGVEEVVDAALRRDAGANRGRGVDYLWGPELDYHLVDGEGRESVARYRSHGFARTIQRYDRLEEVMSAPNLVRFELLGAEAWLIDAAALWKTAREAMLRGPRFFVDRYWKRPSMGEGRQKLTWTK